VGRYDFPETQVGSVREAALWLALDPALADVRERIVRVRPLFPESLRVIWASTPSAQDRALVDQVWRTFRPKGKVEHQHEHAPEGPERLQSDDRGPAR
jgi:hypothetical protein